MSVLIGDLGGTKTILAVVDKETGPYNFTNEKIFSSNDYNSLESIISDYIKVLSLKIDSACLAVAGPIANGCATITNLSWIVDEEKIKKTFNLKHVKLINDLEAVAHSVPILKPADLYTLQEGYFVEGGNIAIIAPGTGLGEAFLSGFGETNIAHPSEGSHASFAPTNALQIDLLNYMQDVKNFEHVSYERICSGALGIPNLYNFLKDTNLETEPSWLKEKLSTAEDPTPIIIAAAKDIECKICISTLELFADILASEAGNLALKVLSTSGIYIGGGISPRILSVLQKSFFLETLVNKGRFKKFLSQIPVKVILNAKAGILGAAVCGLKSE
jgi:glucokinase